MYHSAVPVYFTISHTLHVFVKDATQQRNALHYSPVYAKKKKGARFTTTFPRGAIVKVEKPFLTFLSVSMKAEQFTRLFATYRLCTPSQFCNAIYCVVSRVTSQVR
jgi:hypothetical protein